jgi:hypothetical protein
MWKDDIHVLTEYLVLYPYRHMYHMNFRSRLKTQDRKIAGIEKNASAKHRKGSHKLV